MNNDGARYSTFPLNGSDLPLSETNLASEDVSSNPYYPVPNVVGNQYYRPYDNSSEEWNISNTNYNRGFYPDYDNPHWQFNEAAFYPHYANANIWPTMYVHNYDTYHEYRYPLPDPLMDENAVSSYEFDLDSPIETVANTTAETLNLCNLQQAYNQTLNDGQKSPTDPLETTFQCQLCFRYCVSAGGLKRHAKFCRASPTNLENIFASLKRNPPGQTAAAHPVNLSTSAQISINANSEINVNSLFDTPANPLVTCKTDDVVSTETTSMEIPAQSSSEFTEVTISKSSKSDSSARRRSCPQCSVVVTSERALVQHLAIHNVRKPYECDTCGSRFSRKFHLTRHVKQRGCDGRPRAQFPCEYCSKVFSRKDNLREHVKGHTGQSRPRTKLPCPIPSCNKKFQGRTQLQVHLNAHSGLRPYACDRCDKTFRSNAALKKHLRVHSGERPFVCTQCDARFGAKETLNRHLLTHACSKPHTCPECGKGFIQPMQLKAHMSQHQNDESYCCSICDRTYKRRWRLQQHYRIEHNEKRVLCQTPEVSDSNNNERGHVCDACGKSFALKQSLKVHWLTHVREPPVSCTQCSRAFIRRDCLLRHLRTKHRLAHSEALQALHSMTHDQQYESKSLEIECSLDTSSSGTLSASDAPQSPESAALEVLESNIVELLNLLVEPNALRNFGWPECSVDLVLQTVLVKCGKEPCSTPSLGLAQRLRANTKTLFSFIVDDQVALESLFSRRPIEQVLEQVIRLAKSSDKPNIVHLQI